LETKKFLFTTTFYPPYCLGGDAFAVKYLAEALACRGHDVSVMHSIDAFRLKSKKAVASEEQGLVNVFPIKSRIAFPEPLSAFFLGNSPKAKRLFEKLLQKKPDIVHHHNISLLGFDLLKKRGNYCNIYTAHDDWLLRQNILQFWRKLPAFKQAIESIDFAIAPSNWMKRTLETKIKNKIVVLPNFVPAPRVQKESRKKDFFLFVGSLEKQKGILELVEAISETGKKLVIAGEGSLYGKITKTINSKRLQERISLAGWQSRKTLFLLYSEAQALVLPSLSNENCPLAALEAMACGTPIIVSNVGGLPEIAEKISEKLIFRQNNLKQKILSYNRAEFPNVQSAFEQNFSETAFLKKYLGFFG